MNSPNKTKELQKETIHGRWYSDACGTAFGLELLGERWALLVVRELMFGPRRFSDIRAGLPGISAKVLTERLGSLEEAGVVRRRTIEEPVPARLYELTEWGYRAETVIQEIGRWAAMSPLHDPTLPLSAVSFMLSLRTMLDREGGRDMQMSARFELAGQRFRADLAEGELAVTRQVSGDEDIAFIAPQASLLAALFYGDADVAELETAGVRIEGYGTRWRRFVALFHLPEKIGAPPKPG